MDYVTALADEVRNIQRAIEEAERKRKEAQEANLYAVQGVYKDGSVYINGKGHSYSLASKQIRLIDGAPVYCLPKLGDNNSVVIVGGGAP